VSNQRKKKFTIEPNSTSLSEQNALRSVLNSLKNNKITEESGLLTDKNLDTQNIESNALNNLTIEHSNVISLDTQILQTNALKSIKIGHSNTQKLDTLTPKNPSWTPKEKTILGAKTPKVKTLDTQKKYDYKKYEKQRSTVRVNLHLDKELDKKVRQYCLDAEPRLELKEFFEIAAINFLDTQNNESLGAKTPYDDRRLMISWKTKGHIINLYLRYNAILNAKTRWTVRDDEKSFQLNEVDSRIIELGIIQTQFQKGFKGKINSFGYYLNEINNFNELGMSGEVLDTMLKINRQRWQQASSKVLDYSEFELKTEQD
jgi:hypothetical protein